MWHSGLVLFSVVAKCNVYNKPSLLLSYVKKKNEKQNKKKTGWPGCEEIGILLHCSWDCKLVQPLWKEFNNSSKNYTLS